MENEKAETERETEKEKETESETQTQNDFSSRSASTVGADKTPSSDGSVQKELRTPLEKFNEMLDDFGRVELLICLGAVLSRMEAAWQILSFQFYAHEYRFECVPKTIPPCDSECEEIVFQNIGNITNIITEWKLICDKSNKPILAQTIFALGVMIGSILFGHEADQHGRRTCFLTCCYLTLIMGILCGITPWFWLYCIAKFFSGFSIGGGMICCLVFLVEYVGARYREIIVVMIQFPFALGYCFLPAFAYLFPNWRYMQLIISGFALFFVAYYWFFPESPRWLLLTGQIEKCAELVQSSTRNTNIPRHELLLIIKSAYIDLRSADYPKIGGMYDLFRTKKMRKTTYIVSLLWFCLTLLWYGLSDYIAILSKNIYLHVGITAAIMAIATLLAFPIVKFVERRKVHLATFGSCAICLFFIAIISESCNNLLSTILLLIAIALLSISRVNIQLISTELFPTYLRNSGLGFALCSGGAGGAVALFILQTSIYKSWIPLLIFGCISVISMGLILLLPETKGVKLSDIQ